MDLDDLSNRVLDAIEKGRFTRAEKLCRRLLREYPKMFDGHERLGRLRAAQGRYRDAATHYDIVLGMMRKNLSGIDEETIEHVTALRDDALEKANG
jgi:tetratricopeptide (TPR) repeat protein